MKPAETRSPEAGEDTPNLVRLPRRPRRMTEETSERPQPAWRPEGGSVYDPAPTRPVLRSELQRETGWWLADPGSALPAPEHDQRGAEHDGSVTDLGALRRKRAGDDAPAAGIRRMPRPRRIGPVAGQGPDTAGDQDDGPDSPRPDGPVRR
ncbi:hypothetical protein AB0N05_24945 [Nocardia sp. NPDC051030]|uniref:hypothetical protein n=1 Tax=Nocardia sp. NPDC051030 TaxID=3155162 RepID=UPI00341E36F2